MFAFAAALLALLCSYSYAQCSLSTVRGTWAYQSRSTVMMTLPGVATPVPVPAVSMGIEKINYQGRFTVRGTISLGGQVQATNATGSIQVNPDCTGTDTYTAGGLQGADRLVILENGNEMRMMPATFPLGPIAGVAYLRRLSWGDAQCTGDMVRGVYAGTTEGYFVVPGISQPLPVAGMPVVTFQYGGIGNGNSTASMAGSPADFTFSQLVMAVESDCTATLKWSATSKQAPGQTFAGTMKYIVLNNGNELFGMETDAGSFGLPIILNLKRISLVPLASNQ
jgi:hypothetical protein